jgi:hypothetical protein
MAKQAEVAPTTTEAQVVGFTDAEFEWENVHLEQPDQITFDTIGDTLIAIYLGQEVIEFEVEDRATGEKLPRSFTQLRFLLPGNNPAVVNAGYDLLQAFKSVPANHMVRVAYMKDVDVDQQSPMKSYRVDVGRPVEVPTAA